MGATTALTIRHESTKEEDENGEEDMDAEDAEGEEESTRSPPKKAKKADVSESDEVIVSYDDLGYACQFKLP